MYAKSVERKRMGGGERETVREGGWKRERERERDEGREREPFLHQYYYHGFSLITFIYCFKQLVCSEAFVDLLYMVQWMSLQMY